MYNNSTVSTVITTGFMTGIGQIWLDDVQCGGTETRLIDCPSSPLGNHNCDHFKDAGVRCEPIGKTRNFIPYSWEKIHYVVKVVPKELSLKSSLTQSELAQTLHLLKFRLLLI